MSHSTRVQASPRVSGYMPSPQVVQGVHPPAHAVPAAVGAARVAAALLLLRMGMTEPEILIAAAELETEFTRLRAYTGPASLLEKLIKAISDAPPEANIPVEMRMSARMREHLLEAELSDTVAEAQRFGRFLTSVARTWKTGS